MTTTTFYRGAPGGDVYVMHLDHTQRNASARTLPHSAAGYAWGDESNAARRLAIAILTDALGDERTAMALHEMLLTTIIARLPAREPWVMSSSVVRAIVASFEARAAA